MGGMASRLFGYFDSLWSKQQFHILMVSMHPVWCSVHAIHATCMDDQRGMHHTATYNE
jgi:hypothetical protein